LGIGAEFPVLFRPLIWQLREPTTTIDPAGGRKIESSVREDRERRFSVSLSLEAAAAVGLLIHRSGPHFRQSYTSKVLGNCFFPDHITKKKRISRGNATNLPNETGRKYQIIDIIITISREYNHLSKESDFFSDKTAVFWFDSAEQTINGQTSFARLYLSRDPDGLRESRN
jgi:hypothetical protein